MRKLTLAAVAALSVSVAGGLVVAPAFAADDPAKADASRKDDKKPDVDLPAFPADASVKQVTHVAGKTLNYTATVGSLPVRDEKGKKIVQEWTTSEWPEGYPPSVLELDLKKVPEGTELTMTHSKVPEEQADDYEEGWMDYYWNPMIEYFKQTK